MENSSLYSNPFPPQYSLYWQPELFGDDKPCFMNDQYWHNEPQSSLNDSIQEVKEQFHQIKLQFQTGNTQSLQGRGKRKRGKEEDQEFIPNKIILSGNAIKDRKIKKINTHNSSTSSSQELSRELSTVFMNPTKTSHPGGAAVFGHSNKSDQILPSGKENDHMKNVRRKLPFVD